MLGERCAIALWKPDLNAQQRTLVVQAALACRARGHCNCVRAHNFANIGLQTPSIGLHFFEEGAYAVSMAQCYDCSKWQPDAW